MRRTKNTKSDSHSHTYETKIDIINARYCDTLQLKTAWCRASCYGRFLAKFILLTRRNCYFQQFGQNSYMTIRLSDPEYSRFSKWQHKFGDQTTFSNVFFHCTVKNNLSYFYVRSIWPDDLEDVWHAAHLLLICTKFESRSTYPFLINNVLTTHTSRHAAVRDLDIWPFDLNVCSVLAVTWSNRVPCKFERNRAIHSGHIAISICTNWALNVNLDLTWSK